MSEPFMGGGGGGKKTASGTFTPASTETSHNVTIDFTPKRVSVFLQHPDNAYPSDSLSLFSSCYDFDTNYGWYSRRNYYGDAFEVNNLKYADFISKRPTFSGSTLTLNGEFIAGKTYEWFASE